MTNNKLDKFKALVSDEKSGWLKKAKWRQENQYWLDISFAISVKMLSVLRANKKTGAFPKSQKELAMAMYCTPQYVNKLLKGAEKLNIETISKIQKALKIIIINDNFESKKTEIVAQKEEVFSVRKETVDKKYKKSNGVIDYDFKESITRLKSIYYG